MMRSPIAILPVLVAGCAAAQTVDFGYAFAPPHRITVARPTASEKTIFDAVPGGLTMLWSDGDLRSVPLSVWKAPSIDWRVKMTPAINGAPLGGGKWTRSGGWLPALDSRFESAAGVLRIEAIGAREAALVRVTAQNRDSVPHRFSLECTLENGWVVHNPAWIEPGADADSLLAQQQERADRVLLFTAGSQQSPVGRKSASLVLELPAGATRSGWVVRPYRAYRSQLPELRARDWAAAWKSAVTEWEALIGRAARIEVPDASVSEAYRACLSDLFIMREPLSGDYVGGICGTEVYRSANPFEPAIMSIALDQAGLHEDAVRGLRVHLDTQEPDGDWCDPRGWGHHMWGAAGMKAWAAMEHFRLTGDRKFLESVYPRMLASSRWMERRRATTRRMEGGRRPSVFGLMPRGMGDGGLMNGDDYFGVFYPHNFLAVFADRLALEAAQTLGRAVEAAELRRIHETALSDLRASLAAGAIREAGYSWIPGSPGITSGSRWGALLGAFPAMLMDPADPLVEGTIRHIERNMSPGGHPVHTGWMPDGLWVAISLDNLGEVHLLRNEGDRAAAYLYATLNHATPLYTWCEERGVEPGSTKTSGDRQHLWTPLAVVRYLRDALVMEQADGLHLAAGVAREWLADGRATGIAAAPTHWGPVTYRIESHAARGSISARVASRAGTTVTLHLRHPRNTPVRSVRRNGAEWKDFDSAGRVRFPSGGESTIEATY
jgi:hypothetical protein